MFSNTTIGNFFRSKLLSYIIKRLLFSVFTLFLIITAVFCLIRMMPNEYYNNFKDVNLDNNYHSDIKDSNILNQLLDFYYNILPFPKKICTSTYLDNQEIKCSCYATKIINLGYSTTYIKNVSVFSIIKEKCGASFLVGSIAFALQCLIGYPLGIYMARKENKFVDKFVNNSYIVILSIPGLFYIYLAMLMFMFLKFPITFETNNILSYIPPIATITFSSSLAVAYWVKKYILTETNNDYVKLAISKGLDEKTIFYKHIMRNALIPLIRTIPTSLVNCLCGFYILEAAFNIPGVGSTLMTAINLQDVYLAQGLIIFFSAASILAYFIGDLITLFLDKRTILQKEDDTNE